MNKRSLPQTPKIIARAQPQNMVADVALKSFFLFTTLVIVINLLRI